MLIHELTRDECRDILGRSSLIRLVFRGDAVIFRHERHRQAQER
jgi:cation:H+ antiporter